MNACFSFRFPLPARRAGSAARCVPVRREVRPGPTRRAFVQWRAAGAASPLRVGVGVRDARGGEPSRVALRDDRLVIEFDPAMRSRLAVRRGGG
ncbi:hypothetical protein M3765_24625, partial [Streptomyces thermoviolaceus]|nr:hypothetical protein [Streptomyces thermoviolaceus]